ncbi:MAG: DUF349 domain-containing protein [Pseudohongiellaceae bacterium]
MTTTSIKTTEELATIAKDRGKSDSPEIKATTVDKAEPAAEEKRLNQTESAQSDKVNIKPTAAAAVSTQDATTTETDKVAEASPSSSAPEEVTPEQIETYANSLAKLSFKNTVMLYELRGHLKRARISLPATEALLIERVIAMLADIELLLEKNKGFQDQLHTNTTPLFEELVKALEDGKSEQALPLWDRIQGNISNTSGKIRAELHAQAILHKPKIDELREWKIFAATEAKKKLIVQMQHLIESKMHASDRAKNITALHKDWKTLGRSNENEELWKEFKTLSDKAYEPCKEHFKQRKQLMAENLKKRRALCDTLEKETAELATETVNISAVNKLLKSVEEEWKKHAPVEQSKIKPLQKRYYELLNQLRKLRRGEMKDNAKAKQDCIDQARELAASSDNKKAMQEAKKLQLHWKSIGPTSYKEDRNYWNDFRAACDKIFEHRNEENKKLQSDLKELEQSLKATLAELETLSLLEDESFRASRSQYQTLAQKFSNDLDPRLKQQRRVLTDQFNSIKRKIDTRFKSLPDKKFIKLKQNITAKLDLLESIERGLESAVSSDQFNEAKQHLDVTAWNDLEKAGNETVDKLLQTRWQNLSALKTKEDFAALVQKQSQLFHKQCIDLEIRANIESPESDQATRMEIQLAQLKNAFGKSKPDRTENKAHAKRIEIESLCWGPINPAEIKPLTNRLSAAILRLS